MKDAQSLDQTYETFKQIGKVTGREHEANELVDETKHNVEKVIKSVPRHHRSQSVLWKSLLNLKYIQRQTYIFDDMLSQLDAKNSFSNIEGWKPVDKEGIIKKNPDILISTEGLSKSDYYKVIKNVMVSVKLK